MLKELGHAALDRAGGLRAVRFLNRRSLRILMFHSFLPRRAGLEECLARRCRHLRQFYRPVSLSEAAQAWREGRPLPANAVAVTVDDGYRDFYDIAYPVFRAHEIPAIVYLVTDFMDGKLWLWPDRLRYALEHAGPRAAVHARDLAAETKSMPDRERRRFMDGLLELLDVRIPASPPEEYAPLTWDSVREMAAHGIEFGAHSATHPILSRVEGDAELRAEIEGSKLRIEQELGRPVRHFCYPNGRPEDIGERVVACVRSAGFETAVVTTEGFNRAGADPFLLKRIPADPDYTDRFFAEYVAGLRAR
ncbi:MAG TPA: polysaccharide deacetylase family protein [Bryobacteraceae bacterium]|nr:polysaccharide deacetylase family protein [Bryobacteraceae bacterium]